MSRHFGQQTRAVLKVIFEKREVDVRGLGRGGQRQFLGRHRAQQLRGFLDQHLFADAALVGRSADPASFFLRAATSTGFLLRLATLAD